MTCAACARTIEKQLTATPGVECAAVNLATRIAQVTYRPEVATAADLVAAVEEAGYQVPQGPQEFAEAKERMDLRRRVVVGALLAAPVMVLAMFDRLPLVQFVLTLAVLLYSGQPFYRDAWTALRHRSANMNSLIALGTGAAFLDSVWAVWTGAEDVYFEAAAVIVVLVLLGRLLEARVRGKASDAIRRLIRLAPDTARVVRGPAGGAEQIIPVADVVVGDVIVVKPGERVPVDGTVLDGASDIDESMLTGESLPVSKAVSSAVFGGTLNGTGAFRFRATHVGRETALARIVELVKRAQGSRAPVARLADTVSGHLTVGVLAVAVVTFAAWLFFGSVGDALLHAVAVLIVACPCAMGLATPAAIMAGTGSGALRGLLIKGGDVLELAAAVDTVVLDKTGTVTSGVPELRAIRARKGFSVDEVLRLAAAVERWSEHPVAKAVLARAGGYAGASTDFRALPGRGAEAMVDGRRVFVGQSDAGQSDAGQTDAGQRDAGPSNVRQSELRNNNAGQSDAGQSDAGPSNVRQSELRNSNAGPSNAGPSNVGQSDAGQTDPGQTDAGQSDPGPSNVRQSELRNSNAGSVAVTVESVPAGEFDIADAVRPGAADAVRALRSMGVTVWLITGDHRRVALDVAREVGIGEANVLAGVLPEAKQAEVARLRAEGHRVAMVGDGINDAPALARADVGIAIGAGTDVAIGAAGIILMRSDLNGVPDALLLARRTMRVIRQNLFWAFAYNAIGIPVAAGVLYRWTGWTLSPMLASAAMALSSVSVVANSLRLRGGGRPW